MNRIVCALSLAILLAIQPFVQGEETVAELAIRVKKIQDFVLELKADHEKRIEALETANTSLQQELVKAKSEIRRKDALIETARDAGFGNRTHFVSALHIFSKLPAELQPDAEPGWDSFTLPKVTAWLKKVPIGEPYKATLKVDDASISKNYSANASNKKPPYVLSIRFYGETIKYKNQPLRQYVAPTENGQFKLYGGEAFARESGSIKPGDLIEVSGRIRDIDLKSSISTGPRKCWICLSDYKLTPVPEDE